MNESEEEWSSPKAPKRIKKQKCLIHCTNSSGNLIKPESLESWTSLLLAATRQNYAPILKIVRTLNDDEIGDVSNHRRCRSTFMFRSPSASAGESSDPMKGTSQRVSMDNQLG